MKNAKKIFFTLFLSTLGILFMFNTSLSQQTAGQLFEKALYMEEAQGDLQKAIDLYQEILKQFPENREVAAKAQLHIGFCYEKLGLKEAEKSYQKVVDNYPEQTEEVKMAKEKLAILLKAQAIVKKGDKEFKIRQVWAGPDVNTYGEPSPDGRYLSFTDMAAGGNLAIREIATGKKRCLTKKSGWSTAEFAFYSRWSPDGKSLAYGWFNKDNFVDLRVIRLDGSEPRIIFQKKEVNIIPWDWSPDGKHILVALERKYKIYQIGLVSVADGSILVLKTLDRAYHSLSSVSPNGRYIIYDFPPKESSPERDIFLLSIEGKQEISLVEHPADDWILGWMPDGKSVLFASDRTGTMDAWIIQLEDGKPQGKPILVKKEIGQISPIGFTRQGSFYYTLQASLEDVFIATLDLDKCKVLTAPKKVTQHFEGSNYSPDWSPDGQYLAFVSDRGTWSGGQGYSVLCIRSNKSGEIREVFPKLKSVGHLCWSPDNRSIFATGDDEKDRQGLYKIDTQTGNITLIAQSESGAIIKNFTLSHDRNFVFYPYFQWPKKLARIIRHNLKTGQEKEVYRKAAPPDVGGVKISPDGKYLYFITGGRVYVVELISIAAGEPRELLGGKLKGFTPYGWTPDRKEILLVKKLPNSKKQIRELWVIRAEGGEPRKTGLAMEGMRNLSIHPDGKRIAFTSGKSSTEIWVMENFLPEEKTQKKSKPQK